MQHVTESEIAAFAKLAARKARDLSTPYFCATAWSEVELAIHRALQAAQGQRLFATREQLEFALSVLTELDKVTVITIEVKLPRCWKDLVRVEFIDKGDLWYHGQRVQDAGNRTSDADPLPYHDDERIRNGKHAEGWLVEVNLLSGQSNYWCDVNIFAPNGEHIVESAMWETIEDSNDVESDSGRKFKIVVVWE